MGFVTTWFENKGYAGGGQGVLTMTLRYAATDCCLEVKR